MSGFEVGQRVVCVDDKPRSQSQEQLVAGETYTVASAAIYTHQVKVAPNGQWWNVSRFRNAPTEQIDQPDTVTVSAAELTRLRAVEANLERLVARYGSVEIALSCSVYWVKPKDAPPHGPDATLGEALAAAAGGIEE